MLGTWGAYAATDSVWAALATLVVWGVLVAPVVVVVVLRLAFPSTSARMLVLVERPARPVG